MKKILEKIVKWRTEANSESFENSIIFLSTSRFFEIHFKYLVNKVKLYSWSSYNCPLAFYHYSFCMSYFYLLVGTTKFKISRV